MILILVIIILISIAYVWWVTRYSNIISDDQELKLHTEEDKMLGNWYQNLNKSPLNFGMDDREIATAFIERIYNRKVDYEHIIIGTNLEKQYYKITGKEIEKENYIDVRSLIGKPWEFIIVPDRKVRAQIVVEIVDLNELNDIMIAKAEQGAWEYITDLLDNRWKMIDALNDEDVLNSSGSYLYLKTDSNEDEVIVKQNIRAKGTSKGARINLLCDNWEFETLMKRLRQNVAVSF